MLTASISMDAPASSAPLTTDHRLPTTPHAVIPSEAEGSITDSGVHTELARKPVAPQLPTTDYRPLINHHPPYGHLLPKEG